MRVKQSTIIPSPSRPGYARLSAEVEYDTPGIAPEAYWFEVADKYRPYLSDTGNPWLLCLAPVAVMLGERLCLDMCVDPVLLKNTRQLMKIWVCWFPKLKAMPIEAPVYSESDAPRGSKTLSFFSGGVDAFFTAIYHGDTLDPYDRVSIDDLVNVWGFDIPLSNREAYAKIESSLRRAASALNKEFVGVSTNLRDTQLRRCEWEYLYHGPALAGVAYSMEKKYSRALIASSGGYHGMFPHGTHPAVMPFFSGARMQVLQSGATFERIGKIEWISRSDAAKRSLHVCFHLASEKNCGRCLKCFRTMLTLDLLGALKEFQTFDQSGYDAMRCKRMFLWGKDDEGHARQIRRLAIQRNRMDIAAAVDLSFRRTRRTKILLAAAGRLKKLPGGMKFFYNVEGRLLKDFVGGEERYYPAEKDSLFIQSDQL